MTLQAGKFHFGRHRSCWGVWLCERADEKGSSSRFVKDVFSYEEAVKETYRLNGWGEPKKIWRQY